MSLKSKLLQIKEILGHVYHLPKNIQSLNQSLDEASTATEDRSRIFEQNIKSLDEKVDTQINHMSSMDDRISDIRHQINLNKSQPKPVSGEDKSRFADDHSIDRFYLEFENKFRGSEKQVLKKITKAYTNIFKSINLDTTSYPIIDIGCGRGELLDFLSSLGIRGVGVDINVSMVESAKEKGFEAISSDALEHLQGLETSSIGGVTGLHIVEHIPFRELMTLLEECYRVTTPGGLAVFETPNPKNFLVGTSNFYMDPSHLSPLPPELLQFMLEYIGYKKVEILYLHPYSENFNPSDQNTNNNDLDKLLESRILGYLDYAVIAEK